MPSFSKLYLDFYILTINEFYSYALFKFQKNFNIAKPSLRYWSSKLFRFLDTIWILRTRITYSEIHWCFVLMYKRYLDISLGAQCDANYQYINTKASSSHTMVQSILSQTIILSSFNTSHLYTNIYVLFIAITVVPCTKKNNKLVYL